MSFVSLAIAMSGSESAIGAEHEPTPVRVEYEMNGPYDARLQPGCNEYPEFYVYSDVRKVGNYRWEYELTLRAPNGDIVDTVHEAGVGEWFQHRPSMTICEEYGAGDYRLSWDLHWYDPEGAHYFGHTSNDLVSVSRYSTRSSLSVSDTTPNRYAIVRYKMRAQRRMLDGSLVNYPGTYVALEKNCSGTWSRLKGTKTRTNIYGRALVKVQYTARKACRYRAVTLSTKWSAPSESASVKLVPH